MKTLVLLLFPLFAISDTIIKPTKNGTEIALILIQGTGIASDNYVPPMQTLQELTSYSLWVGIPAFPSNTPVASDMAQRINTIINNMNQAGMKTTTIFYAGHSQGGTLLQDWVYANSNQVTGQILLGSYLLRKYRGNVSDYTENTYPTSTLTVGGELDGICRVTRVMENYWHQVFHAKNTTSATYTWPVVVLSGQNNMQFASGTPPTTIAANDLKPEVTDQEAYKATGQTISNYFASRLANTNDPISQQVQATGVWLQPLIDAFNLEGFAHFKPSCDDYDTINTPKPNCTTGAPFINTAQTIMAGLNDTVVNNTDNFHDVSSVLPDYISYIINNCTSSQPTCQLDTVTVTELVYDKGDEDDNAAATHTSALELQSKLLSRQILWVARGLPAPDLNVSDGLYNCANINQAAYQWALDHANSNTLNRFKQLGLPLTFGEDTSYSAFPLWVDTSLKFTTQYSNRVPTSCQVTSVAEITDVNNPIPLARGFHYCKVLSPARAIEWIYIDGLRAFDSLNSTTKFV